MEAASGWRFWCGHDLLCQNELPSLAPEARETLKEE
jgi:hypothetical protein